MRKTTRHSIATRPPLFSAFTRPRALLVLLLAHCWPFLSFSPPGLAQLNPTGYRQYTQAILAGDSFELEDRFGWALASGDFDGDGFEDLAVGVPYEGVDDQEDAGRVHILYGKAGGPDVAFAQIIDQTLMSGFSNEAGDLLGAALVAGDFDADGYDDLAIGIPYEDLASVVNAGAVAVINGSLLGLDTSTVELWTQTNSTAETSETGDLFGWALAVGDFNDNGVDDLAVGTPGETASDASATGGVTVIYGFEQGGLATTASMHWTSLDAGIALSAFHGSTLAAGNFDGLEGDDLAFASVVAQAPQRGVILFGTQAEGIQSSGSVSFGKTSETGARLNAGDFDNNGIDELAAGFPGDAAGLGGSVNFIGQHGALVSLDSFHQYDSAHETDESGDAYGTAFGVGDFNGDGRDDIAIGGPGETLAAAGTAHGAVLVYAGQEDCCFEELTDQLWISSAVGGVLEDGDLFGVVMTTGDFNGDGVEDLVLGSPFESVGSTSQAGEITMIFGARGIFADGFESGDTLAWQ